MARDRRRLVVALDMPDSRAAIALVSHLEPGRLRLKVGKELFTRAGPALLAELHDRGFETFLDLKFHDIPRTVAAACRAAADLGVWMINVHALGGRRMLEAAAGSLAGLERRPLLTAVTVLTSLEATELAEVGLPEDADALAGRLAALAADTGCDGVVCSAWEAPALRALNGPGFVLVTPGIRPAGSPDDDQRRTMTPADAILRGADHVVVGRPITAAVEPAAAAAAILRELDEA